MKKLILALLPMSLLAQNPSGYWQQQVDYTMQIDFDVKKHQFTGDQTLVYTNNSPDTLHQVFYHLYFNAFQPGSMMDVRSQNVPDPDKRVGNRIAELKPKEMGYHKILALTCNGQGTQYKVEQTLLQVKLNEPILPGATATFKMQFESQVPKQIRRSGRDNAEGVEYTMTQWYPKMAAYDKDGWHPDPYVAREFLADFGKFDVNISIDYRYKLGGTGTMQYDEANWVQTKEEGGLKHFDLQKSKKGLREWRFVAENVHDFAWGASTEYKRVQTKGPNDLELNFYYLPKYDSTWSRLPEFTNRFFELMNSKFGTYPYSQFSVIQGGDGGMEYPMCTMLKGSGKMDGLIGVMVHEAAHNWFYGVLASNENQYPWMDEGFTSFAEHEVLNEMKGTPAQNPHLGAARGHAFLAAKKEMEPLSTPADYFSRNRTYSISAYSRGELFLGQLRYILGTKTFNKGMLTYFNTWKFKHPNPWDFVKVMEDVSGVQLDWYLNFWLNTVQTIDYAIAGVEGSGPSATLINLERVGEMPMPVRVKVSLKNGSVQQYYVSLSSMFGTPNDETIQPVAASWPWTHPSHQLVIEINFDEIEKVELDVLNETTDLNRKNNVWPRVEEEEVKE